MSANHTSRSGGIAEFHQISHEEIEAGMREARRLRAEFMAAGMRRLARLPARLFTRGGASPDRHSVLSALTSLRSSAEFLRDNPEIDQEQRRKLFDIVLKEEARLERLVSGGAGRTA